ncbi:MAG: type II CAAX prenyl endopeptidase Rce1 family protein [Verrucomicrobiales bacterium]
MSSRAPSWLYLLGYFVAVVVGGAALAPWLHALGKAYVAMAAAQGWQDAPLLGALMKEADKAEFQRYFNRSVLGCAVLFLWPAARLLRVRGGEIPGLRWKPGDVRDLACGFLLAALGLLLMGTMLFKMGVFHWNKKADIGSVLLVAGIAAVAVAFVEEWLFRGAFTAVVARTFGSVLTLVGIALLFAVLHFMEPPENFRIPDETVHAGTGFRLAGVMLARLGQLDTFTGAFLALLLVGLMLGWARLATGRLWLGIGLHAGWVFALKIFSGMTRKSRKADEIVDSFWIGGDLRTGAMPLIFLLATGLGLAIYLRMTKGKRQVVA